MSEQKSFFDIFKRYIPAKRQREMLDNGKELSVRYMKDPLRIEVNLSFSAYQDAGLLHLTEEELRALYSAASFRIFPHYPSEVFRLSYMEEVIEEAKKCGAITKGFFDEATYQDDGEAITVSIPYLSGGVQFVSAVGTTDILERILYSRFSIRRKIVIAESLDAAEKTARRKAEYEREYREYSEKRNMAMRAAIEKEEEERALLEAAEARKNAPRTPNVSGKTVEAATVDEGVIAIGSKRFSVASPSPIFGDIFPVDGIVTLSEIRTPMAQVLFLGTVFSVEEKEIRNGERLAVTVGIFDGSSSIFMKKTGTKEELSEYRSIKAGMSLAVKGSVAKDKFSGDLQCLPKAAMRIEEILRSDTEEEKRVELHLHTNMSAMDGIITPAEVVDTAIRWGHKAIAVTDHGNVQAFPEVMLAAEKRKADLKILYGIEAYFVNDTARAMYGKSYPEFDGEMVVFDLETTGLSATDCRITEIGAVRIVGGAVVETFNTFVDPETPIPPRITEITGITDEMVKGAPKEKEALTAFLRFAGDALLVAHNATFDCGFVRVGCERNGLSFPNSYLDTLALSRFLNTELQKHTLDTIAKYYKLGSFNHHRASDDAEMLAAIFCEMISRMKQEGIANFSDMITVMSEKSDPLRLPTYHMIIFAKNAVGLKNLYKLISGSYLTYYKRFPRIPKSFLEAHREGLIIGSACESGELYRAILDERTEGEIEEIADFYDYLEIQPICNNMFLVDSGKVASREHLLAINRRIVQLGKKLGKPVCATCDAHFLNKEDELYRKILLAGQKYADADRDTGIYLRTTKEMLEEFKYLGEEDARRVVIDNPNAIADMCEKIRPIPEGRFEPKMEGAEEELQSSCWDKVHELYGENPPEIVSSRLQRELDSIIGNGFAVLYMIAVRLVSYSEKEGYLVGSRGSVGSSFVATMSGISEVNPLPPHYRCPKCKFSEFFTDGSVGSGFDLPDKACPHCGEKLVADGHDIPFETFLGFYGDKSPDIDLNFSGDVQGKVHKYTEELFGEGHVFRAGTTGTLASKTAYGYVKKYIEERGINLPEAEVNRLISGCVGIKRTTGQHPGGIIVIPREYEIYDFTPVQHPADDATSNIITTHFQFSYLHDTILKLDELGHDMPTKYKMLERYTNTSVLDVKMNDPAVYRLFESTEPLGIRPEDIMGCKLGTYGIPEMGTHFIQQVLIDAKPKNFADLLQISGLTHGTNVWLGNAQDLIKAGTCTISEVVGTRDGIMLYLIRHGLENSMAFKIMEDVRKGKGLKPEYEAAMREHDVPDWYIGSCKKIKYMFPKAHAAAYVMSAIRLGWYKIYYPLEFYAAFLTVAPGGFDAEIVGGGKRHVEEVIAEILKKGTDATQKENEQATTLQLVDECMARGIRFLPVDLQKSDATAFLPENGKIRMPFMSLTGLGENAAQKIVSARAEQEFFSVEDLRLRASLTKSVIEVLSRNGVLEGLSETNQFSLF